MTKIAIHIESITREFGMNKAVDDLSLEVPAGTIFGFLGPNGAGKTTTIHLLLGLLEPTYGRAEVLGFDTQTQAGEIRTRSGALLEHPGLYEQLTAEDNLEFYGRVWGLSTRERRDRIKELLTHMGLWERRKERTRTWSRGMKQKLALSRALLHRPPLVFLDEPTAGIDTKAAVTVRDDLEALAVREGVTVFMTTHNMAEAESLCNLVAVIRDGKLVTMGHPDELRELACGPSLEIYGGRFNANVLNLLQAHPNVVAVEVQSEHLAILLQESTDVSPLINLVVNAGVQVKEIRQRRDNLEKVFLTMMEEES